MKEVLSWIVENYKLLILIVACDLDVVLFLFGVFKKKVDPSLSFVVSKLPSFISHAEKVYGSGHGEEKQLCVVMWAMNLYRELTGVDVSNDSSIYKLLVKSIEEILETPQKKGK